MDCFNVTILGCGSATPTLRHLPTAQVVNFRDKLFLVDCGEGTQVELRRRKVPFSRIGHIFLSHLHGDHCFGLIGFLSTLGLTHREGEIVVHAQPQAEQIFQPMLDAFCKDLPFTVRFASFGTRESELIYEDKTLKVKTIPLHHRVPTCGFLFEEQPREPHLNIDVAEALGIPMVYYRAIKAGNDWTDADGIVHPNAELTIPADAPKKYAYCSDTMYAESIIPIIEGADLLYHEATYMHDVVKLAHQRTHSTAQEAAIIAQKAHVKKLCLGHYSARYTDLAPLLAEAQNVFPNTILGDEGLVVEV